MKIGINGFGRIGRVFTRALFENRDLYNDIEITVINTPGAIDTSLHLLKYDSVYRRFEKRIEKINDHSAYIDNSKITFLHNKEKFNWSDYDVDLVVECSGRYRNLESLKNHFGDIPVVVSAPVDGIKNIIYGVNDDEISKSDQFISSGSCTTNCIAPILNLLHNNYKIINGFVTTIHAYTNDQNLVDNNHKDLYRARAATNSMVPTSTGATKAIGKIIPSLANKILGTAVRVPVIDVSMVDITCNLKNIDSRDNIINLFKNSQSSVLSVTDESLVSSDFIKSPYSIILDLKNIFIVDNMLRIAGWYDNEWAFTLRMLDIIKKIDYISLH